uniref:Uncharacterized protein n=1 Tax=Gossypium raimondii TaxID=29730 RepID=A0A0D2S3N4_GOSRA|nr:hypothetical protein B456_007G005800 [Gossypium raimondii]
MAKRKRRNIVPANRRAESTVQPQKHQSMPPQHEQQSLEQLAFGAVASSSRLRLVLRIFNQCKEMKNERT